MRCTASVLSEPPGRSAAGATCLVNGALAQDRLARLACRVLQGTRIGGTDRTVGLVDWASPRLGFTGGRRPDVIPTIRPYIRGLFFGYRELSRLVIDALRETRKPVLPGSCRQADHCFQTVGGRRKASQAYRWYGAGVADPDGAKWGGAADFGGAGEVGVIEIKD